MRSTPIYSLKLDQNKWSAKQKVEKKNSINYCSHLLFGKKGPPVQPRNNITSGLNDNMDVRKGQVV